MMMMILTKVRKRDYLYCTYSPDLSTIRMRASQETTLDTAYKVTAYKVKSLNK